MSVNNSFESASSFYQGEHPSPPSSSSARHVSVLRLEALDHAYGPPAGGDTTVRPRKIQSAVLKAGQDTDWLGEAVHSFGLTFHPLSQAAQGSAQSADGNRSQEKATTGANGSDGSKTGGPRAQTLEEFELAEQNKKDQSALAHDPHRMREIFPQLYRDVNVNHNHHIDKYEINQGLANPKLTQDEKNLLAILKEGYDYMRLTVEGKTDDQGVSADSLAVIDKALNPKLFADPIYAHEAKAALWAGLLAGSSLGSAMSAGGDIRAKASSVGFNVLMLTGLFESLQLIKHLSGEDRAKYDDIAFEYKDFADHY